MEAELVVIGGGPAGAQCALSAATEGIDTILVESGEIGGQIRCSPHVENVGGFVHGFSGEAWSSALEQQLYRMGVRVVKGRVNRLAPISGLVSIENGPVIDYKAVVIATGKRFRGLEVRAAGEETIHLGPSQVLRYPAHGKKVAVVGGGNSAAQPVLYLSERAESVSVWSRSNKMSHYLTERVNRSDRIEWIRARVEDIYQDNGNLRVVGQDDEGRIQERAVDCVFICAGLVPNTDWLPEEMVDGNGSVLTDSTFRVLLGPGNIFSIGSVRAGSQDRVPAAMGEGVLVQDQLWQLLRQEV